MDLGTLGTQIGVVIVAAGSLATGIFAGIMKMKRDKADMRAAVAEDTRDRSIADSQKIVYDMLNERLKTVEEELRAMKLYTRKLEVHISKLERIMRASNLDVPELEI